MEDENLRLVYFGLECNILLQQQLPFGQMEPYYLLLQFQDNNLGNENMVLDIQHIGRQQLRRQQLVHMHLVDMLQHLGAFDTMLHIHGVLKKTTY